MTVNGFVKMVDRVLNERAGLSSSDFPDIDFSNYFEEDMSVSELNDSALECAMDILYDNGYVG